MTIVMYQYIVVWVNVASASMAGTSLVDRHTAATLALVGKGALAAADAVRLAGVGGSAVVQRQLA